MNYRNFNLRFSKFSNFLTFETILFENPLQK